MPGGDSDEEDVGLARTAMPATGLAPTGMSTSVESVANDDEHLGDRPEGDELVRKVARAKIAGALFKTEDRVKLGRYHLLELVGAGGMGVVWGAWDPELDRRVAIKLVKATMQSARDRILLEGQALAKLSHPNVVPVFDVGVVDDQVYLVMEWVRGANLREYAKQPRSVRELVAVYRDAGEGLSAAHRAGLIHRDFKPDNAIRGDDGRVRVLDFGLAREGVRPDSEPGGAPSSLLTRGAGTPRYMPPEQAQGGVLTPAVDQFAFCISLREALTGRTGTGVAADVPGWLDQIITRGTNPDAGARFPSMDELLRALARDPATIWRRRLIAAGAVGAAAAAFAIGSVQGAEPERCVGGTAEIAKTWNGGARDRLGTHLAGIGAFAATEAERLGRDLDAYSKAWAGAHKEACLARDRGELTPPIYERTLACLARSRVAMATTIDVLTTVPEAAVADALVAARKLPEVDRCATEAALSDIASPPPEIAAEVQVLAEQVERARVLAFAHDERAREVASTAVTRAVELPYLPLRARAYLAQGLAESNYEMKDAALPLARATRMAFQAGDEVLAVEAYARAVHAVGTESRERLPTEAVNVLAWLDPIESIALGLGTIGAAPRALLYRNLGKAMNGAGDPAAARSYFEKARDEVRAGALTDPELEDISSGLASLTETGAAREALLTASVARLRTALGPNHPLTLSTAYTAALFTHDPARAADAVRDMCERSRKFFPNEGVTNYDCLFELGWLALERGDPAEVRSTMSIASEERAASTGEREVRSRVADGFVAHVDGDHRRAAEEMEALSRDATVESWFHGYLADAAMVCGLAAEKLGAVTRASGCYARAVELMEGFAKTYPVTERRLARMRALLARAIEGAQPVRAGELAAAALAWYRTGPGYEPVIAELEALVARVTASR